MARIGRRSFLKSTPVAAGLASAMAGRAIGSEPQKPGDVRLGSTSYTPVRDYPIQPKRHPDVTLRDQFWKPKVDLNASVTIPFEVQKRSEGGRGLSGNVLEAAILSLETHQNRELQAIVDARVRALAQSTATGNSGFEVAATYFHATGRRDLLDPAIKAAASLSENFRVNNPPFSGGERDALNCIQLYRVTHDKAHLDLAKHYLDIRGLENSVNRSRHNQSYMPVLQQREAVGHAVNGVTLMLSMADVGVLTGLKDYFTAAQRMWLDIVERKLYVTGGVGATGNEGFGEPYSLPNISAYAETCAVLMFITFNHRLFLATGDAKYIDVMERGMYNNALSGVALSGDHYFYVNRLASAGDGRDRRWQRASLECCPPNLVRFLASMPGYMYAQGSPDRARGGPGAIYVNLFVTSDATFAVAGQRLTLSVESQMPWGGRTTITMSAPEAVNVPVKVRIPGWARNVPAPGALYSYTDRLAEQPLVLVNGMRVAVTMDKMGYVTLDRRWKQGDVVDIDFPVEPRTVVADNRVRENAGRIAVERGPMVYCSEWPEANGSPVLEQQFDAQPELQLTPGAGPLFDIPLLKTSARSLTKPASPAEPVTLIPYFLWANRGPGEMNVWLSTRAFVPGDIGPAGGFIFYDNPNHAIDGWRYLEAAPFDQSAGAMWGCFRRMIPGARGTAIGTGKQNTADMLAACAEPGTAAQLCATLHIHGVRGWFLPSRDELAMMYRNLRAKGIGGFQDTGITDNFTYWASSQNTADMAAHIDFADLGRLHGDDKDFPRRVRAIRAI